MYRAKVSVVVATTKVRIFKQITTSFCSFTVNEMLLLLPQRYVFSSKSQRSCVCGVGNICCCCYHKGTYFQANHNYIHRYRCRFLVVVATTKVRIFKQITTLPNCYFFINLLLLLPQRYVFSSKSQLILWSASWLSVVVATTKVRIFKQITTANQNRLLNFSCCCYHKGTYFQANHNDILM